MSARDRLEKARETEREARANWFRSLEIVQSRFAPNSIAKDAVDQIKDGASSTVDKITESARKRPGTIFAVGAAVGLLVFRRSITLAVRSKFSKHMATQNDFRSLPEQRLTRPAEDEDRVPVTILTEEV